MGKGLLFFCCSCCILVLTIINLSVGPIISKAIGDNWGTQICDKLKDQKDDDEEQTKAAGNEYTDKQDKGWQSQIDECIRTKGMHDMEYTAFIFDIVIGFVCGLIGLLHLFDLKKDFVSNTGLIGLICGIIGFVLTFVYVIFNGIVFTSKYSGVYERDGDGIFAEQVTTGGTLYKCLYYDDSGDSYAGMAKISDLNKKQYNYKHEFYGTEETRCSAISDMLDDCASQENINLNDYTDYTSGSTSITTTCKNLYADLITTIKNKDRFDRFLTALILSLIVCLANIGLALFGFLLFRTPGDF